MPRPPLNALDRSGPRLPEVAIVSPRFCYGGRFGAVLAAALMLTAFGTAGSAGGEEGANTPQPLLEEVEQILMAEGPFSTRLLEPFTALALRYREDAEHELSLVAIERALQVVRVNRGLYALDQVPLLRQKLANEEARGNDAAVWDIEHELLALARRHPDDVRAAAVLAEIAARQMQVLERYLGGEKPPQVVYGCFYKQWPSSSDGSCTAGSRKIVVQGMLAEAQRNYSAAIGVMLRNGLYASPDLHALETELLLGVDLLRRLYYWDASVRPIAMVPSYIGSPAIEPWHSRIAPVAELASWQPPRSNESGSEQLSFEVASTQVEIMNPYRRGRQSLRRLYMYSTVSGGSALEQADAIAQIGDWDLLYSHNGQAVSSYEVARAVLERAAAKGEAMETLFAPPIPIVLPAFLPNPLAPREARWATGYIDVAFEITKYGRSRAVEVVSVDNATVAAVAELVGLIKSSRFRPRLTAGRFADSAPVAFRYYLY
jgi:hypothetical protein